MAFGNWGIGLIHILSDYSLFLTYTHNVGSTVTKIAVFQLINSFAVPLIAIAGFGIFRPGGQQDEISLWCDSASCCLLPSTCLTSHQIKADQRHIESGAEVPSMCRSVHCVATRAVPMLQVL